MMRTALRRTVPPKRDYRECMRALQRRSIQITTTPANNNVNTLSPDTPSPSTATDCTAFDILASPDPLLSVSLSPSQNLYTRRGSLVGVSGKVDNAVSTLSMLEPFRRAVLRIPFLYQKIASTTPLTALISPRTRSTSLAVVHLDGSRDWILAGKALLAWTGQTLSVRPTINRKMSLAHWGNSEVTGRGSLVLAGRGSIYQLVLKTGEAYVAHPSNVVAYTMNATPPSPFRFKSSTLHFQVPRLNLTGFLPDTKFFRVMRDSSTWRNIRIAVFALRTWLRKTIWGDRLFLQFHGPSTILLQTRAARLNDVFTDRDVEETANVAPGVLVQKLQPNASSGESRPLDKDETSSNVRPTRMSTATVGANGKVSFETASELA